jgi:hypothetical protein
MTGRPLFLRCSFPQFWHSVTVHPHSQIPRAERSTSTGSRVNTGSKRNLASSMMRRSSVKHRHSSYSGSLQSASAEDSMDEENKVCECVCVRVCVCVCVCVRACVRECVRA